MKTYATLAALISTEFDTDEYSYVSYENSYNSTFLVTLVSGKAILVYRDHDGFYELVMTKKQADNLTKKVIAAYATLYSATVARHAPATMPNLTNLQQWQIEKLGLIERDTPRGYYRKAGYWTDYAKHLARQVERQYL